MTEIQYDKSASGAAREALNVPYMRQVPLEAIAAGAAALEYGAEKYADRNWEKGLPWQQMIDSLKRHIDDFERRRDYDDGDNGSGMHQVCMIMASAMMLSASVIREIGEDNRLVEPAENAFTGKQSAKFIRKQLDLAKEFSQKKKHVDVVQTVPPSQVKTDFRTAFGIPTNDYTKYTMLPVYIDKDQVGVYYAKHPINYDGIEKEMRDRYSSEHAIVNVYPLINADGKPVHIQINTLNQGRK